MNKVQIPECQKKELRREGALLLIEALEQLKGARIDLEIVRYKNALLNPVK